MSDDELFVTNFEQLLRWIFGKPVHPKPAIGSAPRFLDSDVADSFGNPSLQRQAVSALKSGNDNAILFLEDFFDSVIIDLEKMRLTPSETDDEDVWQSIKQFLPAKNQISELFGVMARAQVSQEVVKLVIRFFEQLVRFQEVPDSVSRYKTSDWDNYRFIGLELFLTLVAKLIKRERFDAIDQILSAKFYVPGRHGGEGSLLPFTYLNREIASFESRNRRLNLNRISLTADLLRERCAGGSMTFEDIVEADLILYLRESAESLSTGEQFTRPWTASTLVLIGYHGATETFLRATSRSYFDRLKRALGVGDVEQFQDVVNGIVRGKLVSPPSYFGRNSILELTNIKKLATVP